MELLIAAFDGLPGVGLLRDSGTAYLFVNAAHILGIGLLVGAILPLDLRLLGLLRAPPLPLLGPFLSRAAAAGLSTAVVTGAWLFAVNAADYVGNPAFLAKMALLSLAILNVALQHSLGGFRAAVAGDRAPAGTKAFAAASLVLWPTVLLAGRWIAFA
jgi:hypothetical protein